ncbi:MAG: response regulator [Pirellulales bacterium]|nr:response regulator [Pirellulales bacterium]
MKRSKKAFGYILAVVGCLLVLLLRLAVDDALAEQARLLPFLLVVMAAAYWGGFGSGLLATFLSALLGLLFLVPPPFSHGIESLRFETLADGLNLLMFLVVGVTVTSLCSALRSAWRREREKQFRNLADSMPQLVWMARSDGDRFWFNQRWYDYTGSTAAEAMGFEWTRYCDPAECSRLMATWESARLAQTAWEDTHTLRRRDGEMRWHLVRAVPIWDEQGKVAEWFGTRTDIQDRIVAEQVLKEADASKNQFLAILAHELRNPLSPISNALQLWPFVDDDKEKLEQLRQVMDRQVQQLICLIDDLMDLSRIARGKIQLSKEHIDLRRMIDEALEAARPAIDTAGHHLTVTKTEQQVLVDADAVRLRQVFANVLNNAAKFTPPGGDIRVRMEVLAGQATVRIQDNGKGISPAMLGKIFEPFHQVDPTLSRSHGGLGIGLWLAKQIVELHDGALSASSDGLNRGSEFTVTVPRLIENVPGDGDSAPSRRQSSTRRTMTQRRILVVDDVRASAETLAMLLRYLHQDATALYDGESAIQWILDHIPDVAFIDIAMPGLDGYEVARRLRKCPQLQDTFLVALTGYGQEEDRHTALSAGFDYHLTKPAGLDDLEDLLIKLTAGRSSQQSAVV